MDENQNINNDPQLSLATKIFIVVGSVLLIGFGIFYLTRHYNDPEYTRTVIEPDSNMADKELIVKQDTIKKDTAATDSADKEEKEQAAKVFNSIRGKHRHQSTPKVSEESADGEGTTEGAKTSEGGAAASSSTTPAAPTIKPVEVQKPKVEAIE